MQRRVYDRLYLLWTIRGFTTAPWCHFPQPIQAFLLEPAAPQNHRMAVYLQRARDGAVRLPAGGLALDGPDGLGGGDTAGVTGRSAPPSLGESRGDY